MKYLRGPVTALLAFLIGVAVSPIHFEAQSMGAGRMLDSGRGFSTTSYRSSYFVKLTFAHGGYDSAQKANAAFDQHLTEAVQVIDLGPKLNSHGEIVGQRAVAIFFDNERNEYLVVLLWTKKNLLHSIHSWSLVHVLAFEKQNVVD